MRAGLISTFVADEAAELDALGASPVGHDDRDAHRALQAWLYARPSMKGRWAATARVHTARRAARAARRVRAEVRRDHVAEAAG
jgi:hypothetical protein